MLSPFSLRIWRLQMFVVVCSATLTGCHWLHGQPGSANSATHALPENPFFIPVSNRDLTWNVLIDSLDDYFRIDRERRVRDVGGALTEGRIDTYPTIGSSLIEPWRKDSVGAYERLHASLQSIRRQAVVRVIPHEHGYLIDVQVYKELEDIDQPVHGAGGSQLGRHDGTLVQNDDAAGGGPRTLGWIPQGRDAALEHRIVRDIQSRLSP